jgi:hypothetical protein
MFPDWATINDVRGGTRQMREAGELYLPRHPLESLKSYNSRRKTSYFYNAYEHTLQGLVGMIFRQDPVIGNDVPPEIVEDLNNIDNRGTHIDMFLRRVTESVINYGHSFILVDMPPALKTGSNPDGSANLDDYRKAGMRPFWTVYNPTQAVNWRTKTINGKLVLTQITFQEICQEEQGLFGEKEVTRYRVLQPGKWFTFIADPSQVSGFRSEDTGTFAPISDRIPLVCVYGKTPDRAFYSRPLLIDLADLNISHWQLASDYRHILHIANSPVLCRSGYSRTAGKVENYGPNRIIDVAQGGDVWWAEHHGYAIDGARTEILDIEQRMSVIGLSLLARKPDSQAVTATEKILDSAEQSSALASVARAVQDAAKQCLELHARYVGKHEGGSININNIFDNLSLEPAKLAQYSNMVGLGQLSLETLWQILESYGELPENFNKEEELERIAGATDKEAEETGAVEEEQSAMEALGEMLKSSLPTAEVQQERPLVKPKKEKPEESDGRRGERVRSR